MSSERDELAQIIYDTLNSQYGDFNMPDDAADAILAAGWRAPARTIETVEELEELPDGSVVMDSDSEAWQRQSGIWLDTDGRAARSAALVRTFGPLTVLWEPEADDE